MRWTTTLYLVHQTSCFQQACLCCDVDSALKLEKLKKDIDVNRVNKTSGINCTPSLCSRGETLPLSQLLVKGFGANVNVQDRDGWDSPSRS